jgi:hypothetical protein
MDSSKIKGLFIVGVAFLFAVYLGIAVATEQLVTLIWVGGGLFIALCLMLGKNIWILIPMTLPLQGVFNFIPGTPAPWWGAMAVTGGIYVIYFLMRRTQNMVWRFTWLDFAVLIQAVAIGQSFIRNPTGLLIMGGEMSGGKPYFVYAFAFVAYFLLSITKTNLRVLRWAIIFTIIFTICESSLYVLTQLFPLIGLVMLPIYSHMYLAAVVTDDTYTAESSRLTGGKDVGQNIALPLFSLFPPITCINPIYIIRFFFLIIAIAMILLSGFRSAIILVGLYFVVGSLIRRQYAQLMIGGAAGFVALMLLIGSGMTKELPFGIQRILSVVPFVEVESSIRKDAQDSTNFRVEMWVLALTSDRYINNKYLGDGFGLKAAEQRAILNASLGDKRAQSQMRGTDDFMLLGAYHGFHVETIRFTGYFGLFLALVALGIFFKQALVQIRYFKGQREWGYVIFICMPFLIYPFYYMLIYGSYKDAFPIVLASAGLLKMLDNIRVSEIAAARRMAQQQKNQTSDTGKDERRLASAL